MKAINTKGFSHLVIPIVILVVAVVALVGLYVKNRIDSNRSAEAESAYVVEGDDIAGTPESGGEYKTVYCWYSQCYLNPGTNRTPKRKYVKVVGYSAYVGGETCNQTGISYTNRPNARTFYPSCLRT